MLQYLCDQQLYVLLKAVQQSLQRAGVGRAALPSANFRKPPMFVLDLGQNLNTKEHKQFRRCLILKKVCLKKEIS